MTAAESTTCSHCRDLLDKLRKIEGLVMHQVFDKGLWFKPETAPEGYLQQELRRLHNSVMERP